MRHLSELSYVPRSTGLSSDEVVAVQQPAEPVVVNLTQRAARCDEHGDCTVITATDEDGSVVWASHAPSATHPECRANPTLELLGARGEALDASREACDECAAIVGGARRDG